MKRLRPVADCPGSAFAPLRLFNVGPIYPLMAQIRPAHVVVVLIVTLTGASRSQAQAAAPPLVVEPDQYSYTFGVPAGWTFSFEEAQTAGVPLVFFPKGGGFNQSASIVYINYVNSACASTCKGAQSWAIDGVIRDSMTGNPSLHVASAPDIVITAGGKASVRVLSGAMDKRQTREALAFIEHDATIILVVLTTKDPRNWASDYEAFRRIVAGHKFFDCASPNLAVPCRTTHVEAGSIR